jgi:hypothetical protein
VFEQFKENIHLTGETYTTARRGLRSGFNAFRNTPKFQKAMWMSIIGAIVVSSIAAAFSIPWYYQVVLVIGIVVFPLWVWAGRADDTNS